MVIGNPHILMQSKHNIQVHSEISILLENMPNPYIKSQEEIIRCIQFFLILCMGDNINITKIKGVDVYNRNVELILAQGTSNYQNRSKFKNIIMYEDIKDNLEEV